MQLVVLAGGLATRMLPKTLTCPKILLPVNGVPFLDLQMELFARQGVSQVLLLTGHLTEQVEQHVKNSKYKIPVEVMSEGPARLGTGGALSKACREGKVQADFLLTYGDSYLSESWSAATDLFLKAQAPALMALIVNNNKWDKSNAVLRKDGTVLYGKGEQTPAGADAVDYGLLAFKREALRSWENLEKYDLSDALFALGQQGRLIGFTMSSRFFEIGSESGLLELENHLSQK
jgi:NDP-sugar pyrophosphorylase family protein